MNGQTPPPSRRSTSATGMASTFQSTAIGFRLAAHCGPPAPTITNMKYISQKISFRRTGRLVLRRDRTRLGLATTAGTCPAFASRKKARDDDDGALPETETGGGLEAEPDRPDRRHRERRARAKSRRGDAGGKAALVQTFSLLPTQVPQMPLGADARDDHAQIVAVELVACALINHPIARMPPMRTTRRDRICRRTILRPAPAGLEQHEQRERPLTTRDPIRIFLMS